MSVNVWNVAEEDRVNQYMWLSWGGGSKEGGHILFIFHPLVPMKCSILYMYSLLNRLFKKKLTYRKKKGTSWRSSG